MNANEAIFQLWGAEDLRRDGNEGAVVVERIEEVFADGVELLGFFVVPR